ncbi:Lrp/AsnC ligand binding domain-containing protein [Amylibacter sp.]|nr:Lrp/AsnC ligand binding domain-containing protein [Amylibacter sp.]
MNSDSFNHKVKGWILINAEANKEEKAIKSMMKLPEITGLYTTNGKWDLAAEITSTNLEDFDRAISALRSINGVLETETSLLLSSRIGE